MKKLVMMLMTGLMFCALYSQMLNIVTEEYPPYNYTQNGKVTGVSTEVVEAVLEVSGLKGKIAVYPWKRAYVMAENDPNTLIYSMGRTPEREAKFKWVGVVAPYDVYLFSLNSRKDIHIKTLDDAKKYKSGTTQNDAREQYLIKKGFKVGDHIDNSATNAQNLEKLLINRIDLWPIAELVAKQMVKDKGMDPDKTLAKSFHITDLSSDGLYMAFSLSTSDEVVKKFKDGLAKIKKDGTYQRILKKYNIKM
jgi:polar amino acid transport system substrate-binding protein